MRWITKKNQDLFDTFTAQVQLKMIGDKDCFSAEKEKITYVASRVSGPAYKNIRCWVTPVVEGEEGGFKSWQEIPEMLRRIYGVADKHAAAEKFNPSIEILMFRSVDNRDESLR